jgi:hypothetical protein
MLAGKAKGVKRKGGAEWWVNHKISMQRAKQEKERRKAGLMKSFSLRLSVLFATLR